MNDQKIKVRLVPISSSRYSSQVYAGLFDLAKAGEIELMITADSMVRLSERHFGNSDLSHLAYLEVCQEGGSWQSVCYDFLDGPEIISHDGLADCDAYFKRSYSTEYLNGQSEDWQTERPELREKINRYGLNYPCSSRHEHSRIRRALIECSTKNLISKSPRKALSLIHKATLGVTKTRVLQLLGRGGGLMTPECHFDEPAQSKILLQTRIFRSAHPHYEEEVNAFNEQRVKVIRLLKQRFGERFVGGLIPNDIAISRYPDCVTAHSTNRRGYLDLVKRCAIAIHTEGKRHSIGWRLPEYLALSRAVVAEPLAYEIPDPLQEGVNMVTFRSAEECADLCDFLLSNEREIADMRKANFLYYQQHIKSDRLISATLKKALAP